MGRSCVWLVLGGGVAREQRGVQVASAAADCPVWLSGPALSEDCLEVCASAGCDLERLRVDYRALDTLSNFTTLEGDMRRHGLTTVNVVTSSLHLPRAVAIARVVLPAAGLTLGRVVAVEPGPHERAETGVGVWRDWVRAWLWRLVGVDVTAPLVALFHPERLEQRDRRIKHFSWRGSRCFDACG